MARSQVTPAQIPNRTKRVQMQLSAGAGLTLGTDQGPRVGFSGAPSEFARASGILPMDYVAGTDVLIRLYAQVGDTQNVAYNYYFTSTRGGSTASQWNVANNANTGSSSHVANVIKEVALTGAAANFQAGDQVSIAIRPKAAPTNTLYINMIMIEYTADS